MTVGVRAHYPPFSVVTGEGDSETFSGFDVDIARAAAEKIGVKIKFMTADPEEIIPLVAEGIVQAGPGLNHRLSWEPVVDFSVAYFDGGIRALVLRSSGIRRLFSVRGRSVAVISGVDEREITGKIPGAKIVPVDSSQAGLVLLEKREVSAVIGDTRDLLCLITGDQKPQALYLIDEPIVRVPVAFGLPPGDGVWRESFDGALMTLWTSGEFATIYERWFGKKSPAQFPLAFTMEVWPN